VEPAHPGRHRGGIKYFEQAIAEDPAYALAYTGLADYAPRWTTGAPRCRRGWSGPRPRAEVADLDDTLAEAHTSLGWVSFIYDWDWPTAGAAFARALECNPAYSAARQWHSWFLWRWAE
jgi:hypothetical protein